jgi:DNA-binding MarR family transcriptional regulator
MKNKGISASNFQLWLLIGEVNHLIVSLRQTELVKFKVPVRQLLVLRTIQSLGPKVTLSEIARHTDRKVHVISRQLVNMEKDGLIRRIKDTPKSNVLRLEITERGMEILKISRKSKSIDAIFSELSGDDRENLKSILSVVLIRAKKQYTPEN